MIHCAGGYRSAAGASIVRQAVKGQPVYDLGEAISKF
jgi:hydroxyacylglutathione hydrolase